jgi:hypothetical protein
VVEFCAKKTGRQPGLFFYLISRRGTDLQRQVRCEILYVAIAVRRKYENNAITQSFFWSCGKTCLRLLMALNGMSAPTPSPLTALRTADIRCIRTPSALIETIEKVKLKF